MVVISQRLKNLLHRIVDYNLSFRSNSSFNFHFKHITRFIRKLFPFFTIVNLLKSFKHLLRQGSILLIFAFLHQQFNQQYWLFVQENKIGIYLINFIFKIYKLKNINSNMQGKIKLGYWGLRGRGQILRLLLCYTGLQWEDVVYTGPEKWFGNGDRLKLDLDFPNLPYLIRGDFKLTESIAIAKYIAKISEKKDLLGKTPQDEARVQMLMSLLEDIYNPTYSLFFSPNYKTDKNKLFDGKIKDKMDQLQKFVGDKDFAIGYLTLADFKIAQASYYFQKLYDEQYSGYKCFQNIRKSIENLPAVKQYYSRPDAIKEPFLPSYSQLKF